MSQKVFGAGDGAVSPAVDALDRASMRAISAVGDRLRVLEDIGRRVSLTGLGPVDRELLIESAQSDPDESVRHLAHCVLGSLVRWEWWPAEQVAPWMARIEQMEEVEDQLPTLLELTDRVPGYFRAWATLACIYAQRNQAESAAAAIEKGLALRPDDTELQILKAVVDVDRGDLPRALAALENLSVTHPDNPEVRFHAGWVCERMGNYHCALVDYRAAARKSDCEPHWVAVQQTALRLDDWEAVLEADQALVRLQPDNPTHHRQCAVALEQNLRFDDAAWHVAKACLLADPSARTPSADSPWRQHCDPGE